MQLALHDTLTKLPNRILLEDRLEQAIESASRRKGYFAVLFFDLDGFKAVNDAYGHHTGDALLIDPPSASARPCAPRTRWRAWAATNSSCSAKWWNQPTPPMWPTA